MPHWQGIFVSSPAPTFITSLVSLLKHGTIFHLLRSFSRAVCAYLDKGGASDSEHMETDTKSCKYLCLYDLDGSGSESDILYRDVSIPMSGYPAEVSLPSFVSTLTLTRCFSLAYFFGSGRSYIHTLSKQRTERLGTDKHQCYYGRFRPNFFRKSSPTVLP
jgi:hypothetical protein